jgi:phytanoyl-CoA hydroxylase
MKNQKVISDVLWASGNDWDKEWIKQVVDLLVGHTAFTLYPALSQCDNAAERLNRWLTHQLPRIKQAHPGCPIHQWLNSIGAQEIVEKWQTPEQWPNLYWLPLPEVDRHAQGGLVLLPAHFLPVYTNGIIQTRTLQANTPANACIFWCITPLSKTGKRTTLQPKQQNRAFCLPSSLEQIGKSCTGLLLRGLKKESQKQNGKVISRQINLALLHHLCGPENDVWMKASFGTVTHYGTKN